MDEVAMLRFSANLGTLFNEVPIQERFQKAADAGFRTVEVWSPLDEGLAEAPLPPDLATAVRSAMYEPEYRAYV